MSSLDLNRPVVTIFAEGEGLAPEEIETRITLPIESAMHGATGVFRVRSASSIGLALVWVEFDWAMDIYIARQIVAEKLQQVTASLPPTVKPVFGPISSIMGEVMLMGLTADAELSPMELRTLADWTIRPRLLSIKGIAQITVIGGERKEYQVLVDPARLRSYHVSLHEVEEAIKHANANSTGGFLRQGSEEILIRNLGLATTLDDLRQAVVRRAGKPAHDTLPLLLGQVAEVRVGGPLTKRGDAGVNGQAAVILSIQKQPHADTLALSQAITHAMASLRPHLPPGLTVHTDIFRQSAFITRAIANVEEALRDGAILVVVILFFFLGNIRLSGIEGKIFSPLGVAYLTSILASLVVSLTVTPALCLYLLPSMPQMAHTRDNVVVAWLKRLHHRALDLVLRYRWLAQGSTLGLLLAALGVASTFGKEFLPPFNEGSVTINLLLPPGTALEESNRLGAQAERLLLQIPEIQQTGRRTGRAELDDHAEGVHTTEIDVELTPSQRSKGAVLHDIRSRLEQLPGVVVNVGQPISHRIDHLVSGVRAQIAMKIFGPDLTLLRRKAAEIERIAATVPGVVDLQTEKQGLIPQVHVRLNRQKAAQYEVTVGEVA
jgi:Cu/Ag efflux pump CusA